jgi:transposase
VATPTCPGCIERDRRIAELEGEVASLHAVIDKLTARITELERRLNQNSRNSSRPPSTDPPGAPRRVQAPSGRKRGAQPGHPDQQRLLLPPDQVQEVVSVKPERCEHCGTRVEGDDPCPRRHQVTEAPPVQPYVTEYQLHSLLCSNCGAVTTALLPKGVPTGAFGSRLQSIVATFTGIYHLSRRATVGAMDDLFGVKMSLGSVSTCEGVVSEALAKPVAEAREFAEKQAVGYADETGFRERSKRAWAWVFVTQFVVIFLVQCSRSRKAAMSLLGQFAGFLVSDRYKSYDHWDTKRRQLCWAHLLRAFKGFSECRGEAGRIGRELLAESEKLFQWWRRIRDGTLKRTTFQRLVPPVKKRIFDLLEEGTACGHHATEATCIEVLAHEPAMWTFVRHEGIEPTNNAAERAIRPIVLWRKRSFGSQSDRGSRFVERMMTVAATLKRQKRNIVDFITHATQADLTHTRKPSLLPPVSLLRGGQAVA